MFLSVFIGKAINFIFAARMGFVFYFDKKNKMGSHFKRSPASNYYNKMNTKWHPNKLKMRYFCARNNIQSATPIKNIFGTQTPTIGDKPPLIEKVVENLVIKI